MRLIIDSGLLADGDTDDKEDEEDEGLGFCFCFFGDGLISSVISSSSTSSSPDGTCVIPATGFSYPSTSSSQFI